MAKLDSARSEASEPKQRKPAAAASTGGNPAFPGASCCDTQDRKQQHRRALQSLPPSLQRRRSDLAGVLALATILVVGARVTTQELLQPPEAPFTRAASGALGTLLVLFLLSWLGVVVHGPGRLEEAQSEKASQLPPAVASALQAGQHCKKSPFGAEGKGCGDCNADSSVFFTHCSSCNQCSFMMNHHCSLAAQCVGYRNLRCFLVWLGYGYAMMTGIFALSARRVLDTGLPADLGSVTRHGFWCLYMWMCFLLMGHNVQPVLMRIVSGWPSKVLWSKFVNLHNEAKALVAELDRVGGAPDDAEVMETSRLLREAVAACHLKSLGMVAGPFVSSKPKLALNVVMGGPPSWRWLLPLVPSGTRELIGQCPEPHSVAICQAWEMLGQLVAKAEGVLATRVHSPKPGRRCRTPGFQQTMV